MRKMIRKTVLSCVLTFSLITGLTFGNAGCVKTVQAATFSEINQSDMFLKQPVGSKTCTLYAATMLVKRAVRMVGVNDYTNVTPDRMETAAWVSGTGLKWNFSLDGISVTHAGFSGSEDDLVQKLAEHPEGIVVYKQKSDQNHAILVTDYTDGQFYCADPSQAQASGRIPISSASIAIKDSNYVWYVNSPVVYLKDSAGNIVAHDTDASVIQPTATPVPTATTAPTKKKTTTTKTTETTETTKKEQDLKKVTQFKVKNVKKRTFKTSWNKVSGADGYQLLYGVKQTFAGCGSISQSKTQCNVKKLIKGKTYYIKVRAYSLNEEKRVYGECSTIKKVKVKK